MADQLDDLLRRAVSQRAATAAPPRPFDELELERPAMQTPTRKQRNLLIAAVIATAVAGIGFWALLGPADDSNVVTDPTSTTTTLPNEESTTTTSVSRAPSVSDTATEFWEAAAAGDRQATVDLIDAASLDAVVLPPAGLVQSTSDQFDWYEAVGWQWRVEGCVDAEAGSAECTTSATNAWSEVMGLDPVVGRFLVEVDDGAITAISEIGDPFSDQWLSFVFPSFFNWVTANHPDDAATMFQTEEGLTPEILELYELNTTRFVEARTTDPTE